MQKLDIFTQNTPVMKKFSIYHLCNAPEIFKALI